MSPISVAYRIHGGEYTDKLLPFLEKKDHEKHFMFPVICGWDAASFPL